MNGRFLLDTNAVVALLHGNQTISQILQSAKWVGISIITELEFLAFSGLTTEDEVLFRQFKSRVEVIDLQTTDNKLLEKVIAIRKSSGLKMPDAIIAASAAINNATVLTQDAGFSKIDHLAVQRF